MTDSSTQDEKNLTNAFNSLNYIVFLKTPLPRWLGVPLEKSPTDLWIYQEIIVDQKPDFIIETGSSYGGSALFMAMICDTLGKGKVISIDIRECQTIAHPRINFVKGSSVDSKTVDTIKKEVEGKKVMVVLDSDHSKEHVLRELNLYKNLVSLGCYLIVEDTNDRYFVQDPGIGIYPSAAVEEFMKTNSNYQVDYSQEKFLLTFNPGGYLKRIS